LARGPSLVSRIYRVLGLNVIPSPLCHGHTLQMDIFNFILVHLSYCLCAQGRQFRV